MKKKLKNVIKAGLVGLVLTGCAKEEPKKNEYMYQQSFEISINGRVDNLDERERSLGWGYPPILRSFIIESNGRKYYISTTGRNKWVNIKTGDSIALSGEYDGLKANDNYAIVTHADLRLILRQTQTR